MEGLGHVGLERRLDGATDPERARELARGIPFAHRLTLLQLEILARVGAESAALSRLLLRRPRLLDWLAAGENLRAAKPLAVYAQELERRTRRLCPGDLAGLMRALRRYRAREALRLGVRELLGTSVALTAREMAELAEACLGAALGFVEPMVRERHGVPEGCAPGGGFCVLGMGKLGGGELNFSSDVDLIFVYAQDGRTSGGSGRRVENGEHFARLAELLVQAIGETTEDGFAFRVDLGLRPDGRSGPLVNSARALEQYYEAWGRTWERAALLKARAVAGDRALAAEVLSTLAPFVWRRATDAATLEEMRALKARTAQRARAREDDVKLGPGGIREIEFFIQALQLLHGGRDLRLRERSTLGALANALVAGLLGARDHDQLRDAWLFLRRLEHRLQMAEERRTHALPPSEAARRRLALGLGFATIGSFEAELALHRGRVRELFGDLLCASGLEPALPDPALATAADPDAPDSLRLGALGERGFADPAAALASLARLSRDRASPFARRGGPAPLSVALLKGCAESPDPDLALLHLGELLSRLRAPAATCDLLAREPSVARVLTTLFASSDFLSKELLRHPELLDGLVRSDAAIVKKGRARLTEELSARLAEPLSLEQRLGAMRRFKNEEVLRIGLHDVAQNLETEEVLAELTDLADTLIAAALALAREEAVARFGLPREEDGSPALFAVVGLGTLGGRELGYQSDLDLLFVYSAAGAARAGASNAELFSRLAQRLLSSLSMQLGEGFLYRTDVRLRPSGNAGTLVVSRQAFAEHHRRAQVWERQALTRARLVAGDEALFARLRTEVLTPCVWRPETDPAALAREILRVRERMERELAQESATQADPKLGRGGLVDVEFAVQYLQLVHGAARPSVREPNTLAAIAALARAGALTATDAARLERAWRFLRRLENRLRIVHDFPLRHLPRQGPALEKLARRLGYPSAGGGARLLAEYAAITEEARQTYARILGC